MIITKEFYKLTKYTMNDKTSNELVGSVLTESELLVTTGIGQIRKKLTEDEKQLVKDKSKFYKITFSTALTKDTNFKEFNKDTYISDDNKILLTVTELEDTAGAENWLKNIYQKSEKQEIISRIIFTRENLQKMLAAMDKNDKYIELQDNGPLSINKFYCYDDKKNPTVYGIIAGVRRWQDEL